MTSGHRILFTLDHCWYEKCQVKVLWVNTACSGRSRGGGGTTGARPLSTLIDCIWFVFHVSKCLLLILFPVFGLAWASKTPELPGPWNGPSQPGRNGPSAHRVDEACALDHFYCAPSKLKIPGNSPPGEHRVNSG